MRYIIDTDIGDDIDDALAIDLALRLDLDVIGITTVYRNTDERARIAKRLTGLYGRDIPVYKGYGCNMDGRTDTSERLCQYTPELYSEIYSPNENPSDAVDFIVSSAKKYGGGLTIIAIGPLTNIAKAVQRDADALRGIDRIVIMGGDYVNQYAEWNILCDIAAAKLVFEADLPMLCFGHELTSKTRITEPQQQYLFSLDKNDYERYLGRLARLWYKSKPEGHLIILHDVLTVYHLFNDNFCRTVKTPVKVEDRGEFTKGMTVNLSVMDHYVKDDAHYIEYAACDEIESFRDIYFGIISAKQDIVPNEHLDKGEKYEKKIV